jgi:hypothetical protein
MSLLIALLHWLFGRRAPAAESWRLRRADIATYLMAEIMQGAFWWDDPEDRGWLLQHLACIEAAAFRWAPRRCRRLGEAMVCEVDLAAVYVRLEEARNVLLGPRTKPIHGKAWKMRKGRKFLHRRKFIAWLSKRRGMKDACRRRAARGPPSRVGPPCSCKTKTAVARAPARAQSAFGCICSTSTIFCQILRDKFVVIASRSLTVAITTS